MRRLILPGLEPAVARIKGRVVAAIDALAAPGRSALWTSALAATRALAEAPQHHLRGQLVLVGHLAGGGAGEGDRVEHLAAGVELVHLFLLVHDDLTDEAHLRRGQPTLDAALARSSQALRRADARSLAMVMGDVLSVLGTRMALEADPRAAAVVLEELLATGVGQFHDVVAAGELDPARVRDQLEAKSAHQAFVAPLVAGLALADAAADREPARAWAVNMGVALQAYDDVLDLTGDPLETGKDNLKDIIEGRSSLAVSVLLERASEAERALVTSLFGSGPLIPADRMRVQRLLVAHRVVEECQRLIAKELEAAGRLSSGAPYPPRARAAMAAMEQGLGELVASLQPLPDP